MTRKEQIRNAYKLTGGNASFYDGMMTYSTLPGKAICRAVWNMDAEKNLRYKQSFRNHLVSVFGCCGQEADQLTAAVRSKETVSMTSCFVS